VGMCELCIIRANLSFPTGTPCIKVIFKIKCQKAFSDEIKCDDRMTGCFANDLPYGISKIASLHDSERGFVMTVSTTTFPMLLLKSSKKVVILNEISSK